jgi:type IV secretion system protein VirD4
MDGGKCILQVRGTRPFLSEKFDITKHKNYRYLSDANPKNAFNINRHVSTKLKVKPDEDYAYYEHTPIDEEMPMEVLDDFVDYEVSEQFHEEEDLEPF